VRVEAFPACRSFARVHHLTADVVSELLPELGARDALEALFPGGSITGAPKLAAMEILAELEGEGRGFFTGSLGFADLRGNARFNILIRTLFWRPAPARGARAGELGFSVGGGITWDSEPAAEEQETWDKARGLLDALGLETPGAERETPDAEWAS
jgi:anthranilate/para-aminobenzoate synthase component I